MTRVPDADPPPRESDDSRSDWTVDRLLRLLRVLLGILVALATLARLLSGG
jgi:hypothetical protein